MQEKTGGPGSKLTFVHNRYLLRGVVTTTQQVFEELLESYGPQHWWPGESPLEVMLGAMLVQHTSWKNVEHAIENLRADHLIDCERLLGIEISQLEERIRPAGYFRRKARRIRSLMQFVVGDYNGSIDAMRATTPETLREQLLAVHGVGPETADVILLYALEKPAMVVDTYTLRVYTRHGWIGYEADYHRLQRHLVNELTEDVSLYNEFHALLVQVGKDHCRQVPSCAGCPLEAMLPSEGIVAPCC